MLSGDLDFIQTDNHSSQELTMSMEEVCALDMFLFLQQKFTGSSATTAHPQVQPAELKNIIDITPDETISRTPLVDRWLWPAVSPPASSGKVVLVGDAWHPMTPNLGQGACCALEDAVILARKLADAIKAGPDSIDDALRTYGSERWPRVFPLTIRASLVGSLLQWDNLFVWIGEEPENDGTENEN